MVDTHSKWPEVIPMSSTAAVQTIEALRQLFGSNGIPEQLVIMVLNLCQMNLPCS